MTRNSSKTTKMIALVSKPSELKSVFEQLRARHIQVFPVTSFENAMKILETGAVDYCLLSVDFSKIDVYELPQKIEAELNVPVIAISELRDKQSMWRLTKVKTKNTLYSKANAQTIFSRIQLIRKAQQESKSKSAQRAALANSAKQAKQRDERREDVKVATRKKVEAETRETNVVLIKESRPLQNKVRLLTPPLPKSVGTVKLTQDVKLVLPPVKIKFTEIKAGDVREEASLIRADFHRPVMHDENGQPISKSFFNRDVDYKKTKALLLPFRKENDVAESGEVEVEVEVDVHFNAESEVEFVDDAEASSGLLAKTELPPPEDLQKVILGCLKNALGEFCNPNELRQQATEFSHSMVISVNSKNLVGTFIISAETAVPKLGDVQTQLYDYLRTFGFEWQQDEIKVELLTDQKVPIELITAGVYVAGVAPTGEVAITYYTEAVKVPELGLTNNTQHVIDPRNLVKNTRLNFDIYLHLRVNSRDLHYVKVGSNIEQKQIEKLVSSGLTPWVPRNQLKNLNEYVLLQRLLKFVNPDEIESEIEELLKIS